MSLFPTVSLVLLLSCLLRTQASLMKRATAPQRVNIPLTLDRDRRYSVQVNMSSGPQPQSFSFALSTGTGYTVVAGPSCSSCNNVKSYNVSASPSAEQIPRGLSATIFNGKFGGSVIKEDCSLRKADGSFWAYPDQTVIVANQSEALFSSGNSGIIGLGTNARDGRFNDTIFAGWLQRNPGQTNFTYGMALNSPEDPASAADAGVLHLLDPDTNAYEGQVTWMNMEPAPTPDNDADEDPSTQVDWFVKMDSWSFRGTSGVDISQSGGNMPTTLDPFFSAIIFPLTRARSIYSSVNGAEVLSDSAVTIYKLPCDSKMTLKVTFAGFPVTLDESKLVKRNGQQCTGTIQGWSSPAATQYLFGSSFLSILYIIFSIPNDRNGVVGIAKRSAEKKARILSIVGVTLGSVAFAVMVGGLGAWYYFRRKKKRNAAKKAELADQVPHPYPSTPGSPRSNEETVLLAPEGQSPAWTISSFSAGVPSASSHRTFLPMQMAPSGHLLASQSSEQSLRSTSQDAVVSSEGDEPPPYVVANPSSSRPVTLMPPPEDRKRRRSQQ